MLRGLLVLLALLVATWCEFEYFPGHTYLNGETQLLVPMLERLDAPGFLSRDLVATNPNFTYTIYDEITQLLHSVGHLSFQRSLAVQQLCFRFASIFGVFLLARGCKVDPFAAVVLSVIVNGITWLASPNVYLTSVEPTPASFALALVLFAAGLLIHGNVLIAGVAGGFALLYDPVTSIAFWSVALLTGLCNPSLRRYLRPLVPIFVIFLLLLGNLVQLQAGIGQEQTIVGRMSDASVSLTKIRTPWIWPSYWLSTAGWSYLFLAIAGVWALARLWRAMDRLSLWIMVGLVFAGAFSVMAQWVLLRERVPLAAGMPLTRNLAFAVAISALFCGAVAAQAFRRRRWREAVPFAALVIALIFNAQLLDLLHLEITALPLTQPSSTDLEALNQWALSHTWGSSMFQFMGDSKSLEPGIFRASSLRSLWADWESGLICDTSEQAGLEWSSRWQRITATPYSTQKLKSMLDLPVDYYVLPRHDEFAGVRPVFVNKRFAVYDAQDLREAELAF